MTPAAATTRFNPSQTLRFIAVAVALAVVLAAPALAAPPVVSIDMTPASTIADQANIRRAAITTAPMTGCPSRDFGVTTTIGSGAAQQTFSLIVDTGSSSLGVAGDACSCNGVTPPYATATHTANGATNLGATVTATFGDQSGWTANIWTDTVALGTLQVTGMNIGVMTSQTNFFSTNCQQNTPSGTQGILGMAYQNLALKSAGNTPTYAFPDRYEQMTMGTAPGQGINKANSLQFSMLLCPTSGKLFLFGSDPAFTLATPYYIPITENLYYAVSFLGLSFTDHTGLTTNHVSVSTANGATTFGRTIVDSGSTNFIVPQAVLTDINAYLNTVTAFTNAFGADFLIGNVCSSTTMTKATLNANLPWMRLDFANGFAIVVPPVSSYLLEEVINGATLYCPGVQATTLAVSILGYSIMNNFITIFDRSNTRFSMGSIGFAPTLSCNNGGASAVMLLNNGKISGNQTFPAPGSGADSHMSSSLVLSSVFVAVSMLVSMLVSSTL